MSKPYYRSIPSSMYSVKKLLVLRNNNIGYLPAPVAVKKSVLEKRPWINSIRAIEVSNNKISMISKNFVLKELVEAFYFITYLYLYLLNSTQFKNFLN